MTTLCRDAYSEIMLNYVIELLGMGKSEEAKNWDCPNPDPREPL